MISAGAGEAPSTAADVPVPARLREAAALALTPMDVPIAVRMRDEPAASGHGRAKHPIRVPLRDRLSVAQIVNHAPPMRRSVMPSMVYSSGASVWIGTTRCGRRATTSSRRSCALAWPLTCAKLSWRPRERVGVLLGELLEVLPDPADGAGRQRPAPSAAVS